MKRGGASVEGALRFECQGGRGARANGKRKTHNGRGREVLPAATPTVNKGIMTNNKMQRLVTPQDKEEDCAEKSRYSTGEGWKLTAPQRNAYNISICYYNAKMNDKSKKAEPQAA